MRWIILAGFLMMPSLVAAEGAKAFLPQATYQDDGDAPIPFAVTCASNSWTLMATSDTIRRSLVVQSSSDSVVGICISSITTTGFTCSNSTPGVELGPGRTTWTDYSHAIWYCRSRAFDPSLMTVKGIKNRDAGDYGYSR